tara:strand:+ start:820 stop:1314 length:495 start_codon:yes stop_codon:yes gene_type:complete
MHNKKEKSHIPNLVCHPLATDAFELSRVIFSARKNEISKPKLTLLSRTRKLKYFQRADGRQVFISGWLPLVLGDFSISKEDIINGPSGVEFHAWLYLLETIFLLSKKNEVLLGLTHYFSHAPEKVKARIFGLPVPRTIQAQLVAYTGESRASIRHYLSKVEATR